MTLQNKLLKNVDPDIYRKFRAYCVGEGLTIGRALSALMTGVLKGVIELHPGKSAVNATSVKDSWTWKESARGETDDR
jgi:hypothetical protein